MKKKKEARKRKHFFSEQKQCRTKKPKEFTLRADTQDTQASEMQMFVHKIEIIIYT